MNTNDLIIKLGENLETLTTQYSNCIVTNNFNEALNVMKNIDMVVKQLKELDFQTMTCKHGTYDSVTEEHTKQLSIWKQNGFGQIKDHEVFTISDGIGWCEVTPIDDGFSKSQNSWYEVLKFFIKTKQSQLIKLDYSNKEDEMKHRGTGKTTALLQLANDYDVPIFCDKRGFGLCHLDTMKKIAKELNLNINFIEDIRLISLQQYNRHKIILVDENDFIDINSDNVKKLNKVFIGFAK